VALPTNSGQEPVRGEAIQSPLRRRSGVGCPRTPGALADDSGDDNDDNQRRTIPAIEHRLSTVAGHRAWVTVGYGSEGRSLKRSGYGGPVDGVDGEGRPRTRWLHAGRVRHQ
jgi:hypothetical protein